MLFEGQVVHVQRGLQLDRNFTFSHPVRTAVHTGENVVVHITAGNEHVTLEKPLKAKEIPKRFRIDSCINKLVYARKYQFYVAFCNDLYLRIFTEHFKLLQSIPVTNTILSLAFHEPSSVLYAGGTGQISCWLLKNQLDEPLVQGRQLNFKISEKEWVVDISFSRDSPVLCIACANCVYLANIKTHEKFYYIPNPHRATITSATLYTPYHYIITCAKDGSIKVWSYILHVELQTLAGHGKPVTMIRLHSALPYVVSTSLDGTIRLWNIRSLIQSQKYDVNQPITDMSLAANGDILCHTNHNVLLLGISQVESVLSLVNSNVMGLAIPNQSCILVGEHVMVMTEDGGVRIVSLDTGLCLTIQFPMFSTAIFKDAIYCPTQKLLYGLLQNGGVLVSTTQTNPCTTLELWGPTEEEEQVTCITRVLVNDDPVIIGGLFSGFISLLHSTYTKGIGQSCPAHDGRVTHLVSHQPVGREDRPLLASCGKDQLVQIWVLQKRKEISVKNLGFISLDYAPVCISLLQSHLCVATPDNQLFIYDLNDLGESDSISISYVQPVTHSQDDSHTDCIVSLSANSQLNIFASSSKDGRIKVWDTDCQLISEIELGLSLTHLCFDVATSNILLGFQKQLCMIPAAKYLPFQRLSKTKERKKRDVLECPIPFDEYSLWHDTKHITTTPVLAAAKLLSMDTILSPILNRTKKIEATPPPRLLHESSPTKRRSSRHSSVRSATARQLSNNTMPSCDTVPDKTIIPSLNVVDELTNMKADEALLCTDYFKAMLPSNESLVLDKSNEDLLRIHSDSFESLVGRRKALVSPLKNRDNIKYQIAPDGYVPNSVIRATFAKGAVPDIDTPHVYPLFFLRRNQESYLARLRARRRTRTPSSKTRSTASDYSSLNNTTPSPTFSIDEEINIEEFGELPSPVSSKLKLSKKRSSKFNAPLVKFDIPDFSDYKRRKELEQIAASTPSNKPDSQTKFNEEKTYQDKEESFSSVMAVDITKSGKHSNVDTSTDETNSYAVDKDKYKRDFPSIKLKTKFETWQPAAEKALSAINIPTTPAAPSIPKHSSREALHLESFTSSLQLSKKARSHLNSIKSHASQPHLPPLVRKNESRSSTTALSSKDHSHTSFTSIGHKASREDSTTSKSFKSVSKSTSSESHIKSNISRLLRQIMDSSWYGNEDPSMPPIKTKLSQDSQKSLVPKTRSKTVSAVTNRMTDVLMTTDDSTILNDICSLLSDLNSMDAMSDTDKQDILEALLEKSEGTLSSNARRDLLKLLGQLGMVNSQTLLTILRSLTDEDAEVRSAAFSSLKILTGVENRQQLHRLLVDHRFLHHTELNEKQVLSDLEERLLKKTQNSMSKLVLPRLQDHTVSLVALGDRPITSRNYMILDKTASKTLNQHGHNTTSELAVPLSYRMADGSIESPQDHVIQLGRLKASRLITMSERAPVNIEYAKHKAVPPTGGYFTSTRYDESYKKTLQESLRSSNEGAHVDQPVDLIVTPYNTLSIGSALGNLSTLAKEGPGSYSTAIERTGGVTITSYNAGTNAEMRPARMTKYESHAKKHREALKSDGFSTEPKHQPTRMPIHHDRTNTVLNHLNNIAAKSKETIITKVTTNHAFRQIHQEEDAITRAMSRAIEEITDQMAEYVGATKMEETSGRESSSTAKITQEHVPITCRSDLLDHMTTAPYHSYTHHVTTIQDHMTGSRHKETNIGQQHHMIRDNVTANQLRHPNHVTMDYGSNTQSMVLESRAIRPTEHKPTLAELQPHIAKHLVPRVSSAKEGTSSNYSTELLNMEGAIPPPSTRLSHHRPLPGIVHGLQRLQHLPTKPTEATQRHASMTIGYRTLLERMAMFPHSKNALDFMLGASKEKGRKNKQEREIESYSDEGDQYVWKEVLPLILRDKDSYESGVHEQVYQIA